MTTTHFDQFAGAYVSAVLEVAKEQKYYLQPSELVPSFALTTALEMLTIIQRDGIEAVAHYHINKQGGAFARTCAALGIANGCASITTFIRS